MGNIFCPSQLDCGADDAASNRASRMSDGPATPPPSVSFDPRDEQARTSVGVQSIDTWTPPGNATRKHALKLRANVQKLREYVECMNGHSPELLKTFLKDCIAPEYRSTVLMGRETKTYLSKDLERIYLAQFEKGCCWSNVGVSEATNDKVEGVLTMAWHSGNRATVRFTFAFTLNGKLAAGYWRPAAARAARGSLMDRPSLTGRPSLMTVEDLDEATDSSES